MTISLFLSAAFAVSPASAYQPRPLALGQGFLTSIIDASADPNTLFDGAQRVGTSVETAPRAKPRLEAPPTPTAAPAPAAPQLPKSLQIKTSPEFLASLSDPAVAAPLASLEAFNKFVKAKQLPEETASALEAMYGVLSRAAGQEKAETAHILPTLVRFLNDGKKLVIKSESASTALAYAQGDEYDRPESVGINPGIKDADPVAVASVLSHEFQHVYDMYTGRYYALDSEMRGFKTNLLFNRIMEGDPELKPKLAELRKSMNNDTRSWFKQVDYCEREYRSGPQAFAELVAAWYNDTNQGLFSGRVPLREAVDPDSPVGLPRQIAVDSRQERLYHDQVLALTKRRNELLAQPSGLARDNELQMVIRDLTGAMGMEVRAVKDVAINTMRLARMQREAAWLDKTAPASAYDLNLPVTSDYAVP